MAYILKYKTGLLLSDKSNSCLFKYRVKSCFRAHILLVVDEIFVYKSVQTRLVAPQNPSIDTFLVIKVIISYDNFIALDPIEQIWGTI